MAEDLEKQYSSEFFNREYPDRRYFVYTPNYTPLCYLLFGTRSHYSHYINYVPNQIVSSLPNKCLEDMMIYIAHPLKRDVYYPVTQFNRLIMDEILSEFRWVMLNLGARHVYLANDNSRSSHEINKSSTSGSVSSFSAEASFVESHSSERQDYSHYGKMVNYIAGSVVKNPKLPDDLVWYHHMPQWQQLYREIRLTGPGTSFEIEIRSEEFSHISKTECEGLSLKIKDKGMNINNAVSHSLSELNFLNICIKVDF